MSLVCASMLFVAKNVILERIINYITLLLLMTIL